MESHSLPHLKSGAADWRDTSQPAHVPVVSLSNARVDWRSQLTECARLVFEDRVLLFTALAIHCGRPERRDCGGLQPLARLRPT